MFDILPKKSLLSKFFWLDVAAINRSRVQSFDLDLNVSSEDSFTISVSGKSPKASDIFQNFGCCSEQVCYNLEKFKPLVSFISIWLCTVNSLLAVQCQLTWQLQNFFVKKLCSRDLNPGQLGRKQVCFQLCCAAPPFISIFVTNLHDNGYCETYDNW